MGGPGSGRYPRKPKEQPPVDPKRPTMGLVKEKLARHPRVVNKRAAAAGLAALLRDNPEQLENMSREELMKLAQQTDDDGYRPAMFRAVAQEEIDELPPQPKGGQAFKFSLARVQTILNAITSGMPGDYAAVEAGISEGIFYEWMNRFPKFAALVFEAQAARFRVYVTHIAKNAAVNPIAAAIILERLDPKHFGRKDKIEHTVEVTGGVNIQHILIDPRNIELVSELEQRLQVGEIIEGTAKALPEHLEDGE